MARVLTRARATGVRFVWHAQGSCQTNLTPVAREEGR